MLSSANNACMKLLALLTRDVSFIFFPKLIIVSKKINVWLSNLFDYRTCASSSPSGRTSAAISSELTCCINLYTAGSILGDHPWEFSVRPPMFVLHRRLQLSRRLNKAAVTVVNCSSLVSLLGWCMLWLVGDFICSCKLRRHGVGLQMDVNC